MRIDLDYKYDLRGEVSGLETKRPRTVNALQSAFDFSQAL